MGCAGNLRALFCNFAATPPPWRAFGASKKAAMQEVFARLLD